MNFKKSFILTCTLVTSVSIYYLHATNTKVQSTPKSTVAEFTASYEKLFKEKPAAVWTAKSRPTCCGNF